MSEPSQRETDDELLSAYLDDELSPEERATVEARLAADPAARKMLGELRQLSKSVRELPAVPLGRDLRDSIQRCVAEAKRDAAAPPPTFTIGRTRRGWLWASLAVAAALLIMFMQEDAPQDLDTSNIALRNREAPSLTEAPKASAPSERTASTRELAESESAASSRGAGGVGGFAASEPAAELPAMRSAELAADDEQQPVVVHVLAKREALENRAFEKLLVSNGITLEPESRAETVGEATVDRYRTLAQPAPALDRVEAHTLDEEENLEVVLVEAPAPTIESFMDDLNQDYSNYLGVSVDDFDKDAQLPNRRAAISGKAKVDLNQYSRGIVPQEQKESFARSKAQYYHYQSAPSDAADASSGLEEGAALSGQEGRQSQPPSTEYFSKKGRAQRLYVPKNQPQQRDELRTLANQQQSLDKRADDNLQVLFVLTPGEEPDASPAAENRAE